jgi:putative spermidine/putrescine transport system ATP-binding protein
MSNPAVDISSPGPPAAGSGDDIAVRFRGVVKKFGDVTALHAVSLQIARGEFMTLLGPSGCGKTTLLNLVAGFFSPNGGEVLIDDELMNEVPTYKREIGMMFQNYALFPHMTVAANVGYGLKMRGVAKAELSRCVSDVLALVKLTGLEDRKPRQLSGGQQQRVALARALVINPKVLLLDEPFSALDKNLRASMQVELREIQRKLGVTTIFVTHDQSEALSLSDRIAVMSEGRIRQVGTPAEIYGKPCERFVASFVGDANVLRCRLESIDASDAVVALGNARVKVPASALKGLSPSAAVDLFIRPEQLQVSDSGGPGASVGKIVTMVYQGGHVDLYLDSADCVSGRLLVRLPAHEAMLRWPMGTLVNISIDRSNVVAFPV